MQVREKQVFGAFFSLLRLLMLIPLIPIGFFKSIKTKLVFLFLVLALIPILLMRLVAYPIMQKALQNSLIQNLEGVGHKQAESVQRWMDERTGDSKVITNNPFALLSTRINESDKPFPELLKYLKFIKDEYGYKEIFITDTTGMIRIATDEWKVGTYVSGFEYFHEALKGKTFISKVEPSVVPIENEHGELESGVPTMFVSSPIKDKNIIMGVVCMRIDFMQISKLMRSIKLGESGETYLINRDGVMLTESRFVSHLKEAGLIKKRSALELKVVTPKTEELTKGVKECLKGKEGFDGNGYLDYRGAKVLGFWQWIPELQWGVISEIDVDEGYRAVYRLKRNIFILFAGAMTAVIVVSITLAKMVSEPILRLTDATKKMAAGDLSQRVQNRADDEIGALANSFNIMASTINKRNEELQAAKLYLESMFDAIKDAITVLDKDGTIIKVNQAAIDQYGPDLAGKKCYQAYKSRDSICEDCPTVRTIETHKPSSAEHFIPRNAKTVLITSYPLLDNNGNLNAVIKVVRDITEQKKLEKELQNHTVKLEKTVEKRTHDLKIANEELGRRFIELEKANEELRSLDKMKDSIIRDVTHELKSPVAQVKMAIDLWAEEIKKEKIDRRKEEMFSGIVNNNIERLQKTIKRILDLSSLEAGRVKFKKEPLQIEELINHVVIGQMLVARKKGLTLWADVSEKLPMVYADREEIIRVISNLIDNAIKYTEKGEVVISARKIDSAVEVAVSDTGIGIGLPKGQFPRLFERFFQERARVDGAGVGLAICKTIIEAHGGKIWAESDGRGKGATFKFTLPITKEAPALVSATTYT
ncbi:MAG TPA: ATP-binding protein [Candidatus Brocadiia bacterium]